MSDLQKLNRALLGTLMSAETADIVADRIEHLEAEVIGLKAEIARVSADRQALDNILTNRINRSVDVENTLLAIAAGKRAAPTLAECKQLALRLGRTVGWKKNQ